MHASSLSPGAVVVERPRLLVVDDSASAGTYVPALRARYDITYVSTASQALSDIPRTSPRVVITELSLPDGDGVEVCRAVRAAMNRGAAILVTTAAVERVPAAIAAGCNGVLLKPFAPNLLFARLGRLRDEGRALRMRSRRQLAKAHHLIERSELLLAGTNKVWPTTNCPKCGNSGATSFDYSSYRRMWYACLACENVWIAARQEDW
jgi:DNA-binding response OmpR family regulator